MKSNISTLLFVIVILLGCNNDVAKEVTKPAVPKTKITVNSPNSYYQTDSKNQLDLEYLQGIWTSFSYYLEHEEEDKDFHKNEYYKVINKSKCLDIILKRHDPDSISLKLYDIGFTNNKNSDKIDFVNKQGRYFVRQMKSNYINNRFIDVENSIEMSDSTYKYHDMYDCLDDGFNYCYSKKSKVEKVNFKKEDALPFNIFKRLKEIDAKHNTNYVNSLNVSNYLNKVTVKTPKCFFYEDEQLTVKKRAFLIKNDEAYVESYHDESVKVFFDGEVITSGYLNSKMVEFNRK